MSIAERFVVHVPDEVLNDLGERLARTRLPLDFANDDWRYGPPGGYVAELVAYWKDRYDWRAVETQMNQYQHYRVELDGVPIHFMHVRGEGPEPTPLLLSHGWPWSFWDYRDVIDPLTNPVAHGGAATDAFDLIIPSLPGFGFSTPLTRTGIHVRSTADLWSRLMTEILGYPRYAAAGGDWGNSITGYLGHKYADQLVGIHVFGLPFSLDLFSRERNWDAFGDPPDHLPSDAREAFIERQRRFAGHIVGHVLDPQTLAYAFNDSPVGLLAWLLRRRFAWGDCGDDVESRFSKDDLLTSVMMYWVNNAFGSSARFYYELAHAQPFEPSHDRTPRIEAPTGVSLFEPDLVGVPQPARELALKDANVIAAYPHARGGHFAPAEEPGLVVDDLRATFRLLRQG